MRIGNQTPFPRQRKKNPPPENRFFRRYFVNTTGPSVFVCAVRKFPRPSCAWAETHLFRPRLHQQQRVVLAVSVDHGTTLLDFGGKKRQTHGIFQFPTTSNAAHAEMIIAHWGVRGPLKALTPRLMVGRGRSVTEP